MSGGKFARLTDGLLVSQAMTKPSPMTAPETSPFALARKGEAEPSPVMPAKAPPFALHVVPAPVDAPVPAGPTPDSRQHELPALSTVADAAAKRGRMFELSANECEALDFVADKKGTTPQHLLRTVLRNFLVACVVEPCDDSGVPAARCA